VFVVNTVNTEMDMPKRLTRDQRLVIRELTHRRLTLDQLAKRIKLSRRDTIAALWSMVKTGRVTVHGGPRTRITLIASKARSTHANARRS
jgi:predicted Rossmann fold nucleotide-binding protein DprA/Smf involved in DNA uptake